MSTTSPPPESRDPAGESPSSSALRSLRVRASRGTIASFGGQAVSQVLRLGGNLLLARLLFPEAFGLMAIVYLVIFAIDQISNIGTPAAILRFERGEDPRFLDTAFTLNVLRGFGIWFVAMALTPLVAHIYDLPELRTILPVASFSAVLIGFTSTNLLVLTRRLHLGRVVSIELAGQVGALLTMVAIAWWKPSVWALVLGGLANQVVITALSHTWVAGRRNRFAWDPEDARAIYSIGKWVIASSGLSFLLAQMDVALLGRLIDPGMLGVYSMGCIIPIFLRDLAFRLGASVLAPVVAESKREGDAALRERYAAARRLALPGALTLGLGAAIVAPAFFGFLYDARYADAAWIAQLALLRAWFSAVQGMSCLTLLTLGDGRTWVLANLAGLVGVTAGCMLGFEIGGLAGLMLGAAAGSAAGAAVALFQIWRARVASPAPELLYSLVGLPLCAAVLFAAQSSESLIPIASEPLRVLVVGGALGTPYALWTALRVMREMKMV